MINISFSGDNMFGLGMSEIVLIAVIALLVIGPKKLPEVAKALGKGFGEFKKAMNEFKDAVNIDVEESDKKDKTENLKNTYQEKWKKDIDETQPIDTVEFNEEQDRDTNSENGNNT